LKLPYPLFISLRYFRAKKSHFGISLNTTISIGGVALGVMALIIVLSVMSGFHEKLQEKILGFNAHIYVLQYGKEITNYEGLMAKINKIEHVVSSAPFIIGQVMISLEGSGSKMKSAQGAVVRGIDPEFESNTTDLAKNIISGEVMALSADSDMPGIILGSDLSRSLGVIVGDVVNVISPVGTIGPLGMLPKIKKFRVVAVFKAGMYEYDAGFAYIHLKEAQPFFNMQDGVNGIEVKVDDIDRADVIAWHIQETLGYPYAAQDWKQMNKNLFAALKLEKLVMFVILVLIVIVASFNIISNLIMVVSEKSREIAILKAMGATDRGVMTIFMIYGLTIGVIGTAIGLTGGYVTCYLLDTYKFIHLQSDVYFLSYLPVKTAISDFLYVSLSAITISFSATIYPALKASRMNPVEPLRYE